MSSSFFSKFVATGSYLPQKVVRNGDLSKTLDTSDEWIQTRTGIQQRHIAAEGEFTSDLAVFAAKKALEKGGLKPSDVDLVILATASPDHTFPATAVKIQQKMGMTGLAFDVVGVCGGFLLALQTANLYLKGGMSKRALVIGAETMSRLVDWTDRSTAILFGDGAGAVILESGHIEPGIVDTLLQTDGAGYSSLCVTGGASTSNTVGKITMQGREVFKKAVPALVEVSRNILEKHHLVAKDIDWVIPHQANVRIIDAVGERLGIGREKTLITLNKHANTSAASIPLALDEGVRSGRVQPGQMLLFNAFGAGFIWGAMLARFSHV